jgi:hypothetical protein
LKNYIQALDLRPDANVIVSIKAGVDTSTGIASWSFTSLDPATMKFVTDPLAGFLPPDITPPDGIGHVAFSIKPLASLADDAQICNTASIVFDTNAAIPTAPFCNQKDIAAPVSAVQPLSSMQSTTSFTVAWSGTDTGSGIAGYNIYVSDNGAPFASWQTNTTSTSTTYTGTLGHTYGFFSAAVDNLGNTEVKHSADTTTLVGTAAVPVTLRPAKLSFVRTISGTTSPTKTATLKNTGAASVAITSISITGTNASAFVISASTCGASLGPKGSCTLSLKFAPSSVGHLIASLDVIDGVGTQVVSLSAISIAPPAPKAALTPARTESCANSCKSYFRYPEVWLYVCGPDIHPQESRQCRAQRYVHRPYRSQSLFFQHLRQILWRFAGGRRLLHHLCGLRTQNYRKPDCNPHRD